MDTRPNNIDPTIKNNIDIKNINIIVLRFQGLNSLNIS